MASARRVGIRSTVVLICATATASAMVWFAPQAQGAAGDTCGTVTLVLDESGSIGSFETTVRSGLHSFLDPLVDYSIDASIVEFGTSATTVLGPTPVTASNLTSVFDPYVDDTGGGLGYNSPSQLGGWTNWDDALDEVSNMASISPLVFFLTDGDPTAYNLDKSGESGGVQTGAGITEATSRALEEADEIRLTGSHIIAIAVGSGLTSPASIERLKTVAGNDVYPDDGPLDLATTDVIRVPDFGDLPEAMRLIAQAMCADPGITIEKNVDSAQVTVGSEVTYELVVTNVGSGPLFDVEVVDPLVPECSATIGTLAEGESTTITCTTTIWGPLTNTATATGEDPFGTPVEDDDEVPVTVIATGTGTPGYWKNHPDAWPMIDDGIYLGDWNRNWSCDPAENCLFLTAEEAMAALSTPPKGDMTWNLARPLVAAWLNVSAGNESSCVAETINQASDWLATYGLGGDVRGSDDAWAEASGWATTLDDYNNGLLCAEHRDSKESEEESAGDKSTPSADGPKAGNPDPGPSESAEPAEDPGANGNGKALGKGKVKGKG